MKPKPQPERILVRARRCGGDAQAATLRLKRFMIPGMIHMTPSRDQARDREERVRQAGDAAALKGTQALDAWWDSLPSDDIARITVATDTVWKQTAVMVDRQRRDP
jgi:hypothetical protein